MNLIDKAFLLKKTFLFASLDMDVLLSIADKSEVMLFKAGSEIFSEGQPSFSLYVIAEGCVRIFAKEPTINVRLKPLDCFGEESFFNNKVREYSAEAITLVKTLILNKGQFLSIIEECPSVSLVLLESYSKQIVFRDQ
ncbi:cyclic nucleotide-binding domain-containing protein [Chlamydia trachomatis]|uniref:Transcription regulator, crp family n=2 Tax=Chlamydia trachomatis TaxID=813 RepID=A0A6H2W105_CHLTB|nr:cyclic nucleotide-binding domain-containing protein [Chlamydia trachomatis]AEJ77199.1 dnrE protein [Chlamydia trachomatis L2c]AGJ64590.1 Crp/Fnr family transcriptional regulator [Chlamydia trachomatis L2/434/Bu(i)]AGJ65531.1 Crp/Fnr family transcriptional regulator [Chlamydia trachomatis L2/434/Bu(f)]AGR93648.1 Crp family transcriptional regulator [Chlamydia trachomatis RC-F/69]AGR94571.1 Crp family transcriptional regulator [Chlamydia trachomatis RC-L2(s)/46]